MSRYVQVIVVAAVAAVAVTACSSSSSSTSSAAQQRLSQISAATHPSASSSAPAGPKIDLAAVDACALLSATDANSVAHAEMLDEFQTASSVYAFTATKQTDPKGASCKFLITAPHGDDGVGSAVFHVRSAAGFSVPPDGQPISGLGSEAYDTGDSPVVRVGNVVISSDNNSFSDHFTVSLLRKMIAKLK